MTGMFYSDITSLGCHTQLWDLGKQDYHHWVYAEGLDKKLAPIYASDEIVRPASDKYNIPAGVGLQVEVGIAVHAIDYNIILQIN